MKIEIDGQSDLLSIKEGNLVDSVENKIEPLLYSSGKVIDSISFNQSEAASIDSFVEENQNSTFSERDVLTITTKPLKEQIQLAFSEIESCLNKIEDEAIEISENILKTQNNEGLQQLSTWCGDLAGVIVNISNFINTFKVNISDIKLNEKSFEEAMSSTAEFLNEINQAIESNDKTTIADLIEFEITPVFNSLKDVFPLFKQRLEEVFKET